MKNAFTNGEFAYTQLMHHRSLRKF